MKSNKSIARKSITALPLLLGVSLSLAPVVRAQTVPADLATAAKEACKKSAIAKGFTVISEDNVTPKGTDGANVVLSLSKAGHPAKLTCGYTKATGAALTDDTKVAVAPSPAATVSATGVAETVEKHHFPWGWLWLLPLLAIPFFFLGKNKEQPVARSYDTPVVSETYQGIVENNGARVNVHAQPNETSMVIGSLEHGQRVTLSNNSDNNWLQLSDGGWIPARSLRRNVV
jgi:hypothetical protein